jgi:hypothetical protein
MDFIYWGIVFLLLCRAIISYWEWEMWVDMEKRLKRGG